MINQVDVQDRHRALKKRHDNEILLERASWLAQEDRLLFEQVFRHGVCLVDIARLHGVDRRVIRRRIERLSERVNSASFIFMVNHYEVLPKPMRRIGELVILQGQSLRQAMRCTGMGLTEVRRHVDAVRTLADL